MEAVHPYVKACIEALGFSVKKFNGEDHVVIGTLSVMDCSPWKYIDVEYDGPDPEDEDLDPGELKYDCLDIYQSKVEELFGDDATLTCDLDG